jgi:ribonuclease P protein component
LAAERFTQVFSGRQVLRGANFVLHFLANDLAGPRLGLVIPKKQARTAVLRNAIKRQARELFRKGGSRLPAVDVVLRLARPLSRQKVDIVSRAAWRAEIATLFDQLVRKAAS